MKQFNNNLKVHLLFIVGLAFTTSVKGQSEAPSCEVTQSQSLPNELRDQLIHDFGQANAEIILLNIRQYESQNNLKVLGNELYTEELERINTEISSNNFKDELLEALVRERNSFRTVDMIYEFVVPKSISSK